MSQGMIVAWREMRGRCREGVLLLLLVPPLGSRLLTGSLLEMLQALLPLLEVSQLRVDVGEAV